jgi:hypothetical protein
MLKRDKKVAHEKVRIEKFIQANRKRTQIKEVVIPVVFHVFYANEKQRISKAQIQSQLLALNKGFNHESIKIHSADRKAGFYKNRPDKVNIQFCLAVSNPGNKAKLGINYMPSKVKEWGADHAIKTKPYGEKPWNPNKFLNVWIGPLADSVSGYATMPWADKKVDGIVIDYRFFGTQGTALYPFNGGKTLIHLVGNYFGLYDLWSGDKRCKDDKISDTPIHNAPNKGCPDFKHISSCQGNPIEMTMNFMDNTYDECSYMFTSGQMARMHLILDRKGPRHGLLRGSGSSICDHRQNWWEEAEERTNTSPEERLIVEDRQIFNIQPNPANDIVHLSMLNRDNSQLIQQVKIVVYNATGKIYYQNQFNTQSNLIINSAKWPPGLYFVHFRTDQTASTHQLVISR